jgi:hypothetical protein
VGAALFGWLILLLLLTALAHAQPITYEHHRGRKPEPRKHWAIVFFCGPCYRSRLVCRHMEISI